jgi:hypothetical protein
MSSSRRASPAGYRATARVKSPEHSPFCSCGEAIRGAHGQLACGRRLGAELDAVVAGLLEVVADQLVQFHEIQRPLFDPGREALV